MTRSWLPRLMSRDDAAAYSGLSKELIDKRRREGVIEVRYDGDKVLIVRESLDLYLDSLPSERSA